MAKMINLRAPDSLKLFDMSEAEIAAYVKENADRVLGVLPEEIRPAGVNTVVMDAVRPGSAAEPGAWAEWSRSCRGRQDRIEDFEDPILDHWGVPGSDIARVARTLPVDSQLRHATVAVTGVQTARALAEPEPIDRSGD